MRRYAMRPDADGAITVRTTDFDIQAVVALAAGRTGHILAALHAAESLDARTRGVGLQHLAAALAANRG